MRDFQGFVKGGKVVVINDLNYEQFIDLIDNLHDEINIWDSEFKLLYINKACERHYGVPKEKMIGKNYFDLMGEKAWYPALLPHVYKEKVPLMKKQLTQLGGTIESITVPIMDEEGNLKYVISSVRDESSVREYELNTRIEELGKKEFDEKYILQNTIVYKSQMMKDTMELADKLCDVDSPVVLLGETGVGKSLLAREMHQESNRSKSPFITVNCGAIPSELMESEFFGYEEGAFTGAKKAGKKGFFQIADGGTLLLDEVSELPYTLQTKLLHAIQEKEIMPVGATESIKVDVKIIAATNKDLKTLAEEGKYREDLYYRLSVFEIFIPPLRERPKDIEILAYYYLNKFNEKYDKVHTFSKETIDVFKNYSWKGNIRELSHLIERLVVTIANAEIKSYHLPGHLFELKEDAIVVNSNEKSMVSQEGSENKNGNNFEFFEDKTYEDMIELYKREIIVKTYEKYRSSRKVSEKLGISQSKASRLIRKYIDQE